MRTLPVKACDKKLPCVNLRDLRIAHIARQVKDGTYYVSGREIAVKFLLHKQNSA